MKNKIQIFKFKYLDFIFKNRYMIKKITINIKLDLMKNIAYYPTT